MTCLKSHLHPSAPATASNEELEYYAEKYDKCDEKGIVPFDHYLQREIMLKNRSLRKIMRYGV